MKEHAIDLPQTWPWNRSSCALCLTNRALWLENQPCFFPLSLSLSFNPFAANTAARLSFVDRVQKLLMRARAATWSGRGSSSSDDVWFVVKGGAVPRDPPPIACDLLAKRGGSHGGAANWKSRFMQLVGSTLYYSESASKAHDAKGHVRLVGLSVRKADVEVHREGAICIFWPEQPKSGFYMQASNADMQAQWIAQLKEAASPTRLALGELSLQELTQRCLNCGAGGAHLRAGDRDSLEAALREKLTSDERKALEAEHSSSAILQHATDHPKVAAAGGRASATSSCSSMVHGLQVKMRQLVSLEKKRFQQDGFDLDLTYVTPRSASLSHEPSLTRAVSCSHLLRRSFTHARSSPETRTQKHAVLCSAA